MARELLDAVHFSSLLLRHYRSPQKCIYSLQLAIQTQLTHHYIQYALELFFFSFCFFYILIFFIFGFSFMKSRKILQSTRAATSKHQNERATSNIKMTHPILIILTAHKQRHLINYS